MTCSRRTEGIAQEFLSLCHKDQTSPSRSVLAQGGNWVEPNRSNSWTDAGCERDNNKGERGKDES
jgi:hypothetical protein